MRIVAVVLLLASCGRLGFDEGAVEDSAVTVRRQPGGWGPLDLTAEGAVDWAHWGLAGIDDINRKAGVPARIGAPRLAAGGTFETHDKNDPRMQVSWTDGTPIATQTPVSTTLLCDTADLMGDGFTFEVGGDNTTPRTLRFFTGVWCARVRVEAAFDDGSAPIFVDTSFDFPQSSYDLSAYEIDFQANTPDATLVVSTTLDFNYCTTGDVGEMWLAAATLRDRD